MKYFVNLFVIIFIIIFPQLANSSDKIVYININKIINQSIAGDFINKELEKLHNINLSNLNKIKGQYIGLTKISKKIAPKIKNIWLNLYKKNSKTKIDNLYFTDFLTTLIKKKIKLKAIIVKRGWLEFDLPNDLKIPF